MRERKKKIPNATKNITSGIIVNNTTIDNDSIHDRLNSLEATEANIKLEKN